MSNQKTVKKVSNIMINLGFDPQKLTKELRKKSVQNMSHKERCEYINRLKIPFGIVRCTPNLLLKKWLGTNIVSVVDVFNGSMVMMKEHSKNNMGDDFSEMMENFLTQTSFHISHIENGKVTDFGFFMMMDNSKLPIDEIIEEGVVDHSFSEQPQTIGFPPHSFDKLVVKGNVDLVTLN